MSQTTSIKSALSGLSENSILLLDIDNCLLTTKEPVARDEYWSHLEEQYQTRGHSLNDSQGKANQLFNTMQYLAEHHLVESHIDLVSLLKTLKASGVTIYGLTARDKAIADITLIQLANLGITFSTTMSNATFKFNNKIIETKNGIIFCNEESKGDCLLKAQIYFSKPLKAFSHIRFIDDKLNNLQSVDQCLDPLDIDYSTILYTHVAKHYPFDDKLLEIAKEQHGFYLEHRKLLSLANIRDAIPMLLDNARL